MPNSRIPSEPSTFNTYMGVTDDYQLADDPDNPGNPRYKKWNWTDAESDQWTAFRTQTNTVFAQYDTEATVNKTVRDSMTTVMRQVNEYDHDGDTGHRLLDKVAVFGNLADWEIFRVKRSTSLADESVTRTGDVGSLRATLTLRSAGPGEHELGVNNPETPDSHALPVGIKFAEVYRYIGTPDTPPASVLNYAQIGVAKRGIFLSKIDDQTFDKTKKYYAWYIVRYQAENGDLGLPSDELIVQILELGGRGIVN
jgi:hypothetical protein